MGFDQVEAIETAVQKEEMLQEVYAERPGHYIYSNFVFMESLQPEEPK